MVRETLKTRQNRRETLFRRQSGAASAAFLCRNLDKNSPKSPVMSKRLLFSARFSLSPLHILLSPALPSTRRLHKVPFARRSSTYPERNIASLLARSPASASLGVEQSSGGTIRVNGFVRTVRKQKRVAFAAVGDGSSLESLQVVLNPEQAEGSVSRESCIPFCESLRLTLQFYSKGSLQGLLLRLRASGSHHRLVRSRHTNFMRRKFRYWDSMMSSYVIHTSGPPMARCQSCA